MSEEEEEGYEPEEILDTRKNKGKKEVLVKWVDYGSDDNSWEPLQNFKELDVWKNYQEKLSNKRKREKTNSKRKSKKRKKEKKKVKKLKDGDVKNISSHRRKGGKDEYLIKMKSESKGTWKNKTEVEHLKAYRDFLATLEESSSSEEESEVSYGEESGSYKVEKILKERKSGKKKEFLVRWDGFDASHDTWEPEEGIGHTSAYDEWVAKKTRKRKRKSKSSSSPRRKRQKRKPSVILEDEESEEEEESSVIPSESEEEGDAYNPEEDGGDAEESSEEEDDEEEDVVDMEELNEADTEEEEDVSEEESEESQPPKKKKRKKKSKKRKQEEEDDEDIIEVAEHDGDKKRHGKPFNSAIWFDPDKLSDDSGGESDNEDPRVEKCLEKYGRTKTLRQKEKEPRVVQAITEQKMMDGEKHYKIQWKDMRNGKDDTWESWHRVHHLDRWVTFNNKQTNLGKDKKTTWTRAEDRLLCKLTKREDYRKIGRGGKVGTFDNYRFARRLSRSLIAVNNRLKRLGFKGGSGRKRKKKEKKKETFLSEKVSREGDDYEEVVNDFVSESAEKSSIVQDKLTALGVTDLGPELNLKVDKEKLDGHDIVLIVGATGSGKTTLLKTFGELFEAPKWDPTKAVISEIPDVDRAMECLSSVGFMSIPSWLKPYHVLSQGEAYRVLLSMTIYKCTEKKGSWVLLDDFTNNLDRVAARSCASSLACAVRRKDEDGNLQMGKDVKYVLATSNYDIIPFLQPSLVIEIKDGDLVFVDNPNKEKRIKVKALVDMREQPTSKKDTPLVEKPAESKGNLHVSSEKNYANEKKHLLKTKVQRDDNTSKAENVFDHPFEGEIKFRVPPFPKKVAKEEFTIGFISGASGTGKTSTAWTYFGQPFVQKFEKNKAVIHYFKASKQMNETKKLFKLLDIDPRDAAKTFDCLSNGTKERINLALGLQSDQEVVVFDEFTSCQDRISAMNIAKGLCKFCRERNRKCVLVACHSDLLHTEGLSPDWWFSTETFMFRRLQSPVSVEDLNVPDMFKKVVFTRPEVHLRIKKVKYQSWDFFKMHHYKDYTIRSMADCYAAWAEFQNLPISEKSLVAWCCFTIGQKTDAVLCNTPKREHRTVVFPDWQGLGFGSRMCDAVSEIMYRNKSRTGSKTAHPRYGSYRDRSPLWEAMSGNHKIQKKPVNHRDPFKTIKEREQNPEWQRVKENFKPKKYYEHQYMGRQADPMYFDNRVIFIDYDGKTLSTGEKMAEPGAKPKPEKPKRKAKAKPKPKTNPRKKSEEDEEMGELQEKSDPSEEKKAGEDKQSGDAEAEKEAEKVPEKEEEDSDDIISDEEEVTDAMKIQPKEDVEKDKEEDSSTY